MKLIISQSVHTTSASGRDEMRRVEAGCGDVGLFCVRDGVGRVLEQNDLFALDASLELCPVRLGAYQIGQHNELGLVGDLLAHLVNAGHVRAYFHVAKNGLQVALQDGRQRCREGARGRDHFRV